MFKLIAFIVVVVATPFYPAFAKDVICKAEDRICVTDTLIKSAQAIENTNWRDQSYREIAKSLAADARYDRALMIWDEIENPDTKALTIRGIGMAAADNDLSDEDYTKLFGTLREKAESIEHPPSYAIALTYIAMAQAFADDDEGAWATAASMENDALRHKAYGETAEIQAERGDVKAALKSVDFIESVAFRNKSYDLIARIFAERTMFDEALQVSAQLTNAYKKTNVIQYILNIQKDYERSSDDGHSHDGDEHGHGHAQCDPNTHE